MQTSKKISLKAFLTAFIILFLLMILAYVLTFVLEGGSYLRDESGNLVTDSDGNEIYSVITSGIPFWKWILSPFLVLGSSDGLLIISICLYLLIIGAVYAIFSEIGLFSYLLTKYQGKLLKRRNLFIAIVTFFFMLLGSIAGVFEEVIPLVPVVCLFATKMSMDKKTGIAMSMLAAGCGFAVSICNPFSVGVAQSIANVALYSGVGVRIIAFILVYLLLFGFILLKERKKGETILPTEIVDKNESLDKTAIATIIIFVATFLLIILSIFISVLQSFTLYISLGGFVIAGIVAVILNKLPFKTTLKLILGGITSFLPVVLLILMASSVKYTLTEASILDSILHSFITMLGNTNKYLVLITIYFVILVFNFLIPSSSAKAFLILPLILPLGLHFGISAQLCVLAYVFGDGFSNMIYPSNPALLITLNLSEVSYGAWFKYSYLFQIVILIVTIGILYCAMMAGY